MYSIIPIFRYQKGNLDIPLKRYIRTKLAVTGVAGRSLVIHLTVIPEPCTAPGTFAGMTAGALLAL